MYCKNCGDLLIPGEKACPNCGTRVDGKPKKKFGFLVWILVGAVLLRIVFLLVSSFVPGTDVAPEPEAASDAVVETLSDVDIRETVLYDQDGVKLTVTGIETLEEVTYIHVRLQNETDKNIAVTSSQLVVNGITVYTTMYMEAPAGETVDDHIILYSDDLRRAGISEIATVRSFFAEIVDSGTYDPLWPMSFSFETDAARYHEQYIDDSGEVLYESNGLTVIFKEVALDEFFGTTIWMLIRNDTGRDIVIQPGELTIDGRVEEALMSEPVADGTVRFSMMYLLDADQSDIVIDEIKNMTFDLKVLDFETFEPLFETDVLSVDLTN